jgi:inner membrane protein
MLLLSGVAADLDYLSYFGGPATFLRFHRTFLHSLIGSTLIAFATAAAFFFLDKTSKSKGLASTQNGVRPRSGLGVALLVCVIGACSHILLDLISGIGVQLFWPFRAGWIGRELITTLDPWILALLATALLLPELLKLVSEEIGEQKKTTRGRGAAIAALAIFLLYVGARTALHKQAVDLLASREYHGRPPLASAAFPFAATPFTWRGVVSTDTTVEELQVSLLPGRDFDTDRSFVRYKPEPSAALDAGENTQVAKTFLAYARIPFATVTRSEDGYRFVLHDLRFGPNDTSPENIVARVDLNRNLLIQNQELRYASSKVPNFLLDVQRNSYSLVGASRNVKCVTIYSTRRIPTIQSANVLLCVSRKSSAASPYRTASTPSMP